MLRGIIIIVTPLVIFLSQDGRAQTPAQTVGVCWADSAARCPAPYNSGGAKFIACGTSGFSGFNPPFVCSMICGAPVGPRCRITAVSSAGGGQCGYQAARVDCFN
jgi:hypothetical protein